ncbi:hypothetical protein H5410_010450 [Solanum commersonii]|uniref:Uncharacterized protein n=1 Tax=Solanum commersonii TaxID=4109 RepID=A0A9J6AKQ3_SOLCO|nr:hypothetical protein H5410_010450 [Solanum commersonii]
MTELEARLELVLEKHITSLEVEIDLFHYAHPNYQPIVESCRSLLRRLGNPIVRHNFRQGNRLANFLAKEGNLLEVNNVTCILEAAPAGAKPILQAGKNGVATTRSISLSTCTKVAMLGNLNMIPKIVTSSDAITTIATRGANSILTTATVMS